MKEQINKEIQLLSKVSNISALKEKIATIPDTLKLKQCYCKRCYDGDVEISILIEDEYTAKVMEDNKKSTITTQYFIWGVYFMLSFVCTFPFFIIGFDKGNFYNGDTRTILCTCSMGLVACSSLLCFCIGIYRKLKIGRKED